jgi:hypothetical protein
LMEIPGIGEKMVDKIYQAVNRFYEGGDAAAAEPAENTDALAEDAAPVGEASSESAETASESKDEIAEAAPVASEETPAASVGTEDVASADTESEGEGNRKHPEEAKS